LEIIEYCDPENCIPREQFYIDLLKPEYNILPKAGSNLGFKHSEETLNKMRGRIFSIETLAKMSIARKGNKNAMFGRIGIKHPMYGKLKPEGSGRPSQKISVLDTLTNKKTVFDSIGSAAEAIGIKQSRISMYFINNQKKPYKGRYIFQKI